MTMMYTPVMLYSLIFWGYHCFHLLFVISLPPVDSAKWDNKNT